MFMAYAIILPDFFLLWRLILLWMFLSERQNTLSSDTQMTRNAASLCLILLTTETELQPWFMLPLTVLGVFFKQKRFVTLQLCCLCSSGHLLAIFSLLQGHASAVLKLPLYWIRAWQESPKIMIHQENFAFLDPFILLTTDIRRRKKRSGGKIQGSRFKKKNNNSHITLNSWLIWNGFTPTSCG